MTDSQDTLHFTRTVDAPVDHVWVAYADVNARSQWGVPAGEATVHDTADFTTGGREAYRCGPPRNLDNAGTHLYHLIETRRRLLYTDTVHRDGRRPGHLPRRAKHDRRPPQRPQQDPRPARDVHGHSATV